MNIDQINKFYNRDLQKFILGFLLYYIIVSIFNKFMEYYFPLYLNQKLITIVKLILESIFVLILMFNFKKKKMLFLWLGVFSVLFLMGELARKFYSGQEYSLRESFLTGNIYVFGKIIFPFIFIGVFELIKNNKHVLNLFFKILEIILITNAVLVLLGFFFSIPYFQSYEHTSRFGYSGILQRFNFTYLSMIVLSRMIFYKKYNLFFFILSISLLLTGAKVAILYLLLLLFYFIVKRGNKFYIMITTGLLITSLFFLKQIIFFLTKIFPFWQPIFEKYGYITVLFSKRDYLILNTWEYIKSQASIWNLLVGGMDYLKHRVEIDFIDIFLLLGILGGSIYIFLLNRIITQWCQLIPLVAISFAGWVLIAPICMCIYFMWIYETQHEDKVMLDDY